MLQIALPFRAGVHLHWLALEQALQAIAAEPNEPVVVGGVDTFLDLRLLAELDAEQRILGAQVMDGFIPGEGAGFFRPTFAGTSWSNRNSNGRKRCIG